MNLIQLTQGTDGSRIHSARVSSDGEWLVYVQDAKLGVDELWSVRTDGTGGPIRLTAPLGGPNQMPQFEISADGERIVFQVDQTTLGTASVYSVPIEGPAAAAVQLSTAGEAELFRLYDGVALYGEDGGNSEIAYTVPIEGPAAQRDEVFATVLLGDFPSDTPPVITPDLETAVVTAADATTVTAVWSVDLTAPSAVPVDRTPEATQGAISGLELESVTPDSSTAILRRSDFDLYSVPLTGPPGGGVELTGSLDGQHLLGSPDGGYQVFSTVSQDGRVFYSVPTVGPAWAAQQLTPSIYFVDALVTPDGDHFLYREYDITEERFLLRAVPIEGPVAAGFAVGDDDPDGSGTVQWAVAAEAGYVVAEQSRISPLVAAGYRFPLDDLQADGDLIWTLLIDVLDIDIHPKGDRLLLRGSEQGSSSHPHLWTADIVGEPGLEQSLLDPDDLPVGFSSIQAAWWGPRGNVFVSLVGGESLLPTWEIFVLPLAVFADGFESGDVTAWQ